MDSDPRPYARLFVAADVPSPHLDALLALRDDRLDVRWTPGPQLHLTLCFLGDVERSRIEELAFRLGGVTTDPFELRIGRIDAFPGLRHPRVLVALVDADPHLGQLQASVVRVVEGTGVKVDERPFRPHVTIARIKNPGGTTEYLERHRNFSLPAFRLNAFSLYESTLRPGGADHRRIQAFRLV